MKWTKEYLYMLRYKFVSCNQHGDRFKRVGQKELSVANISCELNDITGMSRLILLSHTLDTPVRYDFDEQEAYIKVVSKEALARCI